jgi:putative ABC transport system permease protein
VTWPHWTTHPVRTALTALGVALGVATVTAVADLNASILASFRRAMDTVAGAGEIEVTSPAGHVDEALLETVTATEGVAAAAGMVETFLPLAGVPEESLYLLGLDFLGSPLWTAQFPRELIDVPDELEFLARLDSVAVTRRLAERAGAVEEGALRVVTPHGERTLRVRGLLGDAPPARLFDGMVAVMDLPAAQRLLGRAGRLDRIAVQLAAEARPASVRERLAHALGPRVDVLAAEARGQQSEHLLVALRSMLLSGGALAVIVAAFIVYHTVSVSVRQRRRQFAMLNAVGVDRRILVGLCLVETFALAALGVVAGLGAGGVLAALAAGSVGSAASEIWVRIDVSRPEPSVAGMLTGAVVGVATAMLTAVVAVRATFRTPTVEALRPAAVEVEERGGLGGALVAGVTLAASTWPVVWAAPPGIGFVALCGLVIVTHAVVYLGAALAAPATALAAGAALGRLGRRSGSVVLHLAMESVARSPRRGGAMVATVAVGLGMVVQFTGLVQSFERAWVTWIEQHFGADLFVGSGARVRLMAGPPMSRAVRARLEEVPGVASVEPFRVLRIRLDDRPVFLQGLSLDDRLAHGGLAMVAGDVRTAAAALRAGTGVLVSDNLALRLGLRPGDTLRVPTPDGPRSFGVAGTFADYLAALDLGAVAVASEQLEAVWGDSSANLFRLWLEPGASAATVRQLVLARLGAGFYAVTGRQFLEAVRAVLRTLFLATWALVVVAVVVSIIGVVNAQLAGVLDRAGEIGMLRTIGVSRRDVTASVLLECAVLGTLGGGLGILTGGMLARQMVTVDLTLVTGWRIPFSMSVAPLVAGVLCAGLVSAVAGWGPARVGGRLGAWQRSAD